jgi:hypothetical protein
MLKILIALCLLTFFIFKYGLDRAAIIRIKALVFFFSLLLIILIVEFFYLGVPNEDFGVNERWFITL